MSSSSYQHNVDLYYRKSMLLSNQSPKVGTAFSTGNAGDSSKSKSPSCDSGYHSSSSSSKSNLSQNWKDPPNLNTDLAKQNTSFLANRQGDDSLNPFHEDYYKKAIYHRNNEQPSTNQK
ncbi:hypothetical protein Hanom_Chr00s000718g01655761 [Helianthus anomalus]